MQHFTEIFEKDLPLWIRLAHIPVSKPKSCLYGIKWKLWNTVIQKAYKCGSGCYLIIFEVKHIYDDKMLEYEIKQTHHEVWVFLRRR